MPIPEDFHAQCLYAPEAWFIHDLVRLDPDERVVIAHVDTTRLGALVDAQKAVPGHPKHLPGAICVQLTATLGCLLAAYTLGMPPTEGWVGFGTAIHEARFPSIGEIGPPVLARADVVSVRTFRATRIVRYRFEYTQGERVVYRAEHTAAWFRPDQSTGST